MSRLLALVALVGLAATAAWWQRPSPAPGAARVAAAAPAQPDECAPRPVVPIGEDFFTDISAASGIQDENYVASPATPVESN